MAGTISRQAHNRDADADGGVNYVNGCLAMQAGDGGAASNHAANVRRQWRVDYNQVSVLLMVGCLSEHKSNWINGPICIPFV